MPLREFTGELDKPAGLHEFTGELDPAQRRELPAGVQPSTAGAGRGTQGGPTATQLEQAKPIYERAWNAMRGLGSVDTSVDTVGPPVRRGGMRSEVQPFVAPGQPFASDLVTPNPLGSPSGLPTPPVAVSSPLETVAGESIRPGSEKRIIGRLLARPGTTDATGRVLLQALKPASDSPELGQTVQPGLGPPRSVTLPEIGQDIATAAKQTPNAYKAALVQLKEGGDDPRAIDWKNQEILKAEQYAKDTAGMIGAEDKYVLGITRSTLRRLPQQSAFSVLSMGAGIAAGAGPQLVAGALSRNPIVAAAAGYGTGALGSGIAAYRMDTNQVLRQVRESLNEAAVQARGEPLTDEEFIQVADKYHALVREHGLHEALWEALGNVVEFGMTKVMFKAASAAIKGALLRNAMKFFGAGAVNLLTEVGTEAATQIGQHNVEQKLGIGPGPARSFGSLDDWITSTKEVGPDILLLMGTTGMAAAGAGRVSGMVKGARGAGQTQAEFNAEQMARERGFLTPPDQRKFFYQTFDELAAKHGITPEASKAARAEADGMPLAAVPGFLGRFAESYTTQKGRPMSAVEAANPTPAPEGNAPRGTPQNVTATSKPSEALNVAGIFPEETGLAGPSTTPSVQTTTDAAAHVAAASPLNGHPEPTPGQAEAGNYRKGHVQIAGMDISIENPQGSTRRGVDESGNAWESTMTAHYGYIRNSVGADKEHVDVFIKPGTHQDYAGPVFVVDQLDPKTGLHDEHKALIGYDSQTEAEAAYKSNYAADWQGMGPVTELPMPAFKAWAYSKEAKKPLAAVQRAVPAQAAPESQSAAGTIQGVRHGNEGQEGQRGQGGQGLLAPAAAGAPAPVAPILQNRNRSTPAAIEQMRAIARNPDYNRLGFSRDFSNGAPVVAGGGIAASQFGRSDTATTSDGRQIPVRYAVVEAKQLLASNAVGGETNQRYGNAQVVATRAIAGNGRIAGLQSAYANNRADAYKTALLADDLHGVPRAAIEAMKAPVLVRVMPESEVTANIGDVSNRSGTLTLSPVEQARTDAARVNLDALEFTDAGDVTPEAVRKFVQAMPKAEQGGLIDTDGSPTRQAVDRLNNAVFVRAYPHSEGLVRLYAQATDPEARNVMSALARAAPAMSKLEGAGALDIREIVTQAAEAAVNARRRGVKLADVAAQIDLSADPASNEVLKVFADNPRAAKPIAEALIRAAELVEEGF